MAELDLEKARHVALLKEMKKFHEAAAEKFGSEIAKLSKELHANMIDNDIPEFRISSTYNGVLIFKDGQDRIVKPESKFKPTVVNEELFFSWLKAIGSGALIKQSVHAKTLESFITDRKKQNQPLPAEDILKIFPVDTVNITVGKKRLDSSMKGENE